MKLGKVKLNLDYVVDLDDKEMVQTAKECLYEDISSMIKYNELWEALTVVTDENATEEDISSILIRD